MAGVLSSLTFDEVAAGDASYDGRSFSALRRQKVYLQATMRQPSLTVCSYFKDRAGS